MLGGNRKHGRLGGRGRAQSNQEGPINMVTEREPFQVQKSRTDAWRRHLEWLQSKEDVETEDVLDLMLRLRTVCWSAQWLNSDGSSPSSTLKNNDFEMCQRDSSSPGSLHLQLPAATTPALCWLLQLLYQDLYFRT